MRVLLFGTVSQVSSAGNWPCKRCFFFVLSCKESCFRQKRTRKCYYLELFDVFLLRESGHAKYVFSFYLTKNPASDRKELLSATIWNCFTCSFGGKLVMQKMFFLFILQRILFPTEKNSCLLLIGIVSRVPSAGNWSCKNVFFFLSCKESCFRQKRTRECYYLELFYVFLLREIGPAKYICFLTILSLFRKERMSATICCCQGSF